MSQIKGGRADKAGNAFERLWVASLALEVVEGDATAIKWEALGPEGLGVEVEVRRPGGTREKHQCKIGNRNEAKWTATRLGPVLKIAKTHLESDTCVRFVFVSQDPVRVIGGLASRAGNCDDDARGFLNHCLTSREDRVEYQSLCTSWELDSTDEADARIAMSLLRRMDFAGGIWERSQRRRLYRHAEAIIDGNGKDVVAFLGRFLEENLGTTYRSDCLRAALREQGFPPLDLLRDPRVPEGIEALRNRFCSALEPHLIGAEVLSRPEPEQLVERACAGGGARLLFVTGDAGSGKSGVLLDAIRILDEQAVPHLPIRLDTQYPDKTVRAYSRERLGLPASPGACLGTLADGRRAVLIIDQLDAVRWTSANSDLGWELCKEIIDEALRSPNVSVIVAGRKVDLDDDPRIKRWKKDKKNGREIEVVGFQVGSMPEEVVGSVVERYAKFASLPPREKDLLSNAQNLQLWWRLAEDGSVEQFSSRAGLLREYWRHYRERSVREYGTTIEEVGNLLDGLVGFMDARGRLDAPNTLLERYGAASDALRRLGILDRTNGTTRFAHQSHLDYLTIERVLLRALQGEVTPIQWLRGHDQSLFRRDQVRFLLQLIRDEDAKLYLEFLRNVFFDECIRFHIQHLALTTLAQASPPTDGEHELIKRLWNEELWHLHVLELVLAGHPPWLDSLTDDGTIPTMLASGDETLRHEALFLCCRSAEVAPQWFERVLAPHWDSGDPEWAELIGPRLAHDAEHDSPTVFQWRLARARAGADQPEIYSANRLATKDQASAISYLVAIAEGLTSNVERFAAGDERRRVEVDSERFENLLNACEAHPRLAWDALLPVHARAVAVEEAIQEGSFSAAGYPVQDSARQIISLLHDFLTVSGASLLQRERTSFLADLTTLGHAPAAAHARRLAVGVLATAPDNLSDDAVACFLSVESPLNIDASPESMTETDHLSPQDPAISALRALASSCSGVALQRIERELLAFHAGYERGSVEWQLELIREGRWTGKHPNHYGLPQYALLLALPEVRLSNEGARALRMWRGKFGDLSEYRSAGPVEWLPVASPIPSDHARFVSDDEWVQIVTGERTGRPSERRELRDGKYVDRSPDSYASSLEGAGKLSPGRYIRLGLRFPPDAQESYYTALLRVAAIAAPPKEADESWTAAPAEDVEALIAHISDKENTEIAKGISSVVGERSGESWSVATLSLLREYALHHPHPYEDSRSNSLAGQGDIRSLEMTVLNSARCSAIRAVSQILWAHPDLLDWTTELAAVVAEGSHPAVRAASFDLAYAIGKHDLDLALNLMLRAYEGTDDAVLSVQNGPYLILHLWRREADLAPIFERALASSDGKTVDLAAYWTTVGNTLENLYPELASQAADGPVAARVGVVRALADIAHRHDKHRAGCLNRLAAFLEDEDEKVLDAADRIFRREGFLHTEEAPGFAERFARSAAFRRDPNSVLHQLSKFEGSLLPYADAIEASVAQISGPLATATQSVANRLGLAGRDIATILLRLYQQSEGASAAALKSRCLDQWDALLRARVGTGQDVLRKIDS